MALIETHPAWGGTLVSTFPWRPLDGLHLWIDGNTYYPRMLDAINNAKRSIDFETYLVQSGAITDRFIEALNAAAQRGVIVRLLLDSIGAREFSPADQQRLRNAGVELRFYNPLAGKRFAMKLARDHRKILVIDNRLSFVGGAGVTDSFDPSISVHDAWHDIMLESTGPIVLDWVELFEQTWLYYDGMPALSTPKKIANYLRTHAFFRPLTGVVSQTRVNASSGRGDEQIKADLVKRIRNAKRRVWVATAYFYPSHKLRQALRKAASRGVDVRLLLPGPSTDHPSVRYASRRYFGPLLRSGVMIYEYQPAFLHMKVALVDDWVSLGSCNFDRWNMRWNLEANQEILDEAFASQIRCLFDADFQVSERWSFASWSRRGWRDKFREHFWYQIARFIEFVSLRMRLRR